MICERRRWSEGAGRGDVWEWGKGKSSKETLRDTMALWSFRCPLWICLTPTHTPPYNFMFPRLAAQKRGAGPTIRKFKLQDRPVS